jgi:hypothetical protein
VSPQEIEQFRKEWFEKTAARKVLIEQIVPHSRNHGCADVLSCEAYEDLLSKLRALDPEECVHGRHWSSSCGACDAQHMEAFPEYFGKCTSCQKLVDLDELDKTNHCFDCQSPE